MIIPRVGDIWEFRPHPGKRHKTAKKIVAIFWKQSTITGRACPWIRWSHTPKARYIPSPRVRFFLEKLAIRRIYKR